MISLQSMSISNYGSKMIHKHSILSSILDKKASDEGDVENRSCHKYIKEFNNQCARHEVVPSPRTVLSSIINHTNNSYVNTKSAEGQVSTRHCSPKGKPNLLKQLEKK